MFHAVLVGGRITIELGWISLPDPFPGCLAPPAGRGEKPESGWVWVSVIGWETARIARAVSISRENMRFVNIHPVSSRATTRPYPANAAARELPDFESKQIHH